MNRIVILSGSPSESSRSDRVLKYLEGILKQKDFEVIYISVREIPHKDLYNGNYNSPALKKVSSKIAKAQGLIVGSPVYKASYSGVLKSLIDLLPQDILEHKPVLPIMTGGSLSHLLAIEYTLKPLINILKGQCLKGLYFLDHQVNKNAQQPILDEELLGRTEKQLDYFIEIVHRQKYFLTLSS